MSFKQLDRIDVETGIRPANDNYLDAVFDQSDAECDEPETPTAKGFPRIAFRGEWDGCTFRPDTSQAWLNKEDVRAKRQAEKDRMEGQLARIERRQSIGDPDCPANDNEDFPLLAALRREGDSDSIGLVLKYRRLATIAASQPLQGQRVGGELPTVHRATNLEKQAAEALDTLERDGWKGYRLPGGEISYAHGIRQRKGGTFHLPAQQAVATNEETGLRTAPMAVKFSDDLLIHRIDAKTVLAKVRSALGPLLDPFEDAVLGGQTYTQIGEREGFKVKPDVAGKALVKKAILAAEAALHTIDARARAAERESARRASLRRCEIAVARARFLGRAA